MRPELPAVSRRSFLVATAAGVVGWRAMARAGELTDETAGDVFPLPNCPVCDTVLGGEDIIVRADDRELRVCNEQCQQELDSDLYAWIDTIDEQIVDIQSGLYPLDTCLVDGTPLAGKEPVQFVLRNRLFHVCCDQCWEKVLEAPGKYFTLLNTAVVKKQKAAYPVNKCIVSGKPLEATAIDHVCGNQLVRLADAGQIARFNKSPGKCLEQLRKLTKKA